MKGEFLVVSCQYFRKRLSAYPLCPGLAMTQIELEKIADTFDTNRDGMINLNEIMAVVKGTKRTRGMPERSLSDAEKIDHEVCLQLPILFQCHSLIPNHTSPMVSFSNHTSPIVSFSNHTSPIVSFSNHTSPIVSFPNCMSSVVSFSNHITHSLIPKSHITHSLILKSHITSSLIPKPQLTYLNPRLCVTSFLVSSPDPTQEERVW